MKKLLFTYCTNWTACCCLPTAAAAVAGRVAVRLDTVNNMLSTASESDPDNIVNNIVYSLVSTDQYQSHDVGTLQLYRSTINDHTRSIHTNTGAVLTA